MSWILSLDFLQINCFEMSSYITIIALNNSYYRFLVVITINYNIISPAPAHIAQIAIKIVA